MTKTLPSVEMPVVPYEQRLAGSLSWALMEGSLHFEGKSAVQQTLRRITQRLDALGVDYAVAGGMALFGHGFRRFTEDVDILVTRDGLKAIHEALEGRGYVPPFRGSKNLRDAENGVHIKFLLAGEFPGDGKPKPVAFPDPQAVVWESDGIRYLNLAALIELKLASSMTNVNRARDWVDVQELIRALNLSQSIAEKLDPYVRDRYNELWQIVRGAQRFVQIRRTGPLAPDTRSLDDVIATTSDTQIKAELEAMRLDGVVLDMERSRPATGYLVLVTNDPDVAVRHELHDESEIMYDEPENA